MRYTTTITADTAGTKICAVHKKRDHLLWHGLLLAQGTWGSGTLSWYLSIDGGTTLVPIQDLAGTAITQTANGSVPVNLPGRHNNDQTMDIYIVLSGATGPSLTVMVEDNN